MVERLLRIQHVQEILPVSERTIWRMVKSGRMPKPKRLSGRTVVWPESEIRDMVERIKAGEGV